MKELEFNNQKIHFLFKNDEYYIAIKPLCTALNVNAKHQFEIIKKDDIFGPASRNFGMQVDGQIRKYLFLPEHLVYGWLLQINSNNQNLQDFKKKCYHILYEYFKGTVLGRKNLINQKAILIKDKEKLEIELIQNKSFLKWNEIEKQIDKINLLLRNKDKQTLNESLSLFD